MIETGCMNYDGDIDCAKCTVHGYIYGCEGCDDLSISSVTRKQRRNRRMTDSEKNAVIELKMQLARIVINLDDEKVLGIIRASLKGAEDEI